MRKINLIGQMVEKLTFAVRLPEIAEKNQVIVERLREICDACIDAEFQLLAERGRIC